MVTASRPYSIEKRQAKRRRKFALPFLRPRPSGWNGGGIHSHCSWPVRTVSSGPSGLSLYILTNTCLSAIHSIYMNKYDKKSLALAAQLKKNQATAAAAKDSAAVKAAKDANPAPSDVEQARTKKSEPDGERVGDAGRQLEAKPRVRTSQRRKKGGRR